jgi:hypothetical protein
MKQWGSFGSGARTFPLFRFRLFEVCLRCCELRVSRTFVRRLRNETALTNLRHIGYHQNGASGFAQ